MTTTTHGTPDRTTRRARAARPAGPAAGLAGLAVLAVLLAGCSGDDSGNLSEPAVGGMAQDAGGDAFTDLSAADAEPAEGTGTDAEAIGTDATDAARQVIVTGEAALVAEDPLAAADAVVQAVETAGGRVDGRQQTTAPTTDDADPADSWVQLTLRLPADQVTGTLAALEQLGTVSSLDVRSEDVTGTAQDLDARIRAAQISVARLEDLLSRATTSADVIAAESTLADRQSSLEQLESERARLAERVSLSTLTVTITAQQVEPEVAEAQGGFLGGLSSGWSALVEVLTVAVVVLGALLPWLALAGLVTLLVLGVRRRLRGRRGAQGGAPGAADGSAGPTGPTGPGSTGDDGPGDPEAEPGSSDEPGRVPAVPVGR
jgi:hypothetical protein